MDYLTEKKFDFRSYALPEDTFGVVHFKGYEALSSPYEFDVMLVSEQDEMDLDTVLQNPARLAIRREEGDDVAFNGVLARFEQLHEYGGFVFYKALLVPKLWWLTLTQHNQVCLEQSVVQVVTDTLRNGGLMDPDFEFRVENSYHPMDYVCQYNETHLGDDAADGAVAGRFFWPGFLLSRGWRYDQQRVPSARRRGREAPLGIGGWP